jgi:glutamate/tyrosine decarboxylase-like PLP-dependent enzyme
MDLIDRVRAGAERLLRKVPAVRERIERETEDLLGGLEPSLKPYRSELPTHDRLPEEGRPREEILQQIDSMRAREESRWREGYVSGAVYHGDEEHVRFLDRVYALTSQTNPLHSDLWPSITKFESEVVSMTARMLGADGEAGTFGTVSSGGTESILLAMKAYRDWAREERGIRAPEMVVPTSAHAAFDKAAQYFGLRQVKVPVGPDLRADVKATRRAIGRNTAVVVGSAPSFPHGAIDPIEELSDLARRRGIGFHTDACLGGFLLPWARRLGYPVPPFDFRLPGVTSISCDTHKFGFAAKGTSVVLYRTAALRHHQFYTATEWPGGLYFSPTFAGSRPGALIAACWAALVSTGERGYLDAAERILRTAERIKSGIRSIPGLRVLGDPLFVIAFTSDVVDVYRVLDAMSERRWNLNGLHRPAALHLCVTLRHAQPGVADRFLEDLRASVDHVRHHPPKPGGMAPAYGMAASLPLRGVVSDLLKRYLDRLYRP